VEAGYIFGNKDGKMERGREGERERGGRLSRVERCKSELCVCRVRDGAGGAWCLGFRVWGLGLGAWCLVSGVWCLVSGVWCLGFRGLVLGGIISQLE